MPFLKSVLPGTSGSYHCCQGSFQSLSGQYAVEKMGTDIRQQNINPKHEIMFLRVVLVGRDIDMTSKYGLNVFKSVKCKLSVKETTIKGKNMNYKINFCMM